MFLDLNADILDRIYTEVSIQNIDEIAIFKYKYNEFIKENEYLGFDFTSVPDYTTDDITMCVFDTIQDWISDYINELDQNQINTIICRYGINKSIVLLQDFHRVGLGDSSHEICEIMEDERFQVDRKMVEIIMKDCVNFASDWRKN
jgi:hypothetical protein